MSNNRAIARIFRLMAQYLYAQDIAFKPQAYERAAQSLELDERDVRDVLAHEGMDGIEKIPGVGAALAAKIREYLATGKIKEFERMKNRFPFDMEALARIEGVGPKTAYKLYRKLKIKTVADLARALELHKVRRLAGFGEKSELKLAAHLQFSQSAHGRFLLGAVYDDAQIIRRRLASVPGTKRVEIAGSIRRMKETVRDMDILAVSAKPKILMNYFTKLPGVVEVYGKGGTKASVHLESGIDVDLRVIPDAGWGAALNYFTGSKEHNIALREIAIAHGWKLNEYGLYAHRGKKERQIAGATEKDLYQKLGMAYIEPEMREASGEIQLAAQGALPRLVALTDIQGDLQCHTDWSDGENTLEDMAAAAVKLRYKYIAVTDHTKSLGIARGMDEKTILRQFAAVDALNKKFRGVIRVLKGLEVNILKNGLLDIADAVLAKADVVGAAVHSHFSMPQKHMTDRIVRAMENRHVDIVFHPTGRLVLGRPGYAVDVSRLAAVAKRTKTLLEINAYPERLDLGDQNIRLAKMHGAMFSLGTDSHTVHHLQSMRFGVGQARRGWCEKKDVVNAKGVDQLLAFFKNK